MKPKLILFLLLLTANCGLLTGTVRFVSKTGTSTPPYTTWATASDSIQKCINFCQSGDTVYVANGVYKEKIIMIPGLALIGGGMDSCIVNTLELVTAWDDIAIQIADSCLLRGFSIIVSYNRYWGMGVAGSGSYITLVSDNKISNANIGVFLDATFFGVSNFMVYNNIITDVGIGVDLFNSSAIVRRNILSLYGYNAFGIIVEAFDYTYKPTIDSNYIEAFQLRENPRAIMKSFGTNPTIQHNVIVLKTGFNVGTGIGLGGIAVPEDSTFINNNLIISEDGFQGIDNSGVQNLQLHNNYITGKFYWPACVDVGISNKVKNNTVVTENSTIRGWSVQNDFEFKYNNAWGKNISYTGFTPDSTNLSIDPMVMRDTGDIDSLDFHLQKYSPMIDTGDPNILDRDSSRSDIGLYGGPYGESYDYHDLPPRTPVNFSAIVDSPQIKLIWNKNTEADFSKYRVYRDTVAEFQISPMSLAVELEDTFYVQQMPMWNTNYYYKLTAIDNQKNESAPSVEIFVNITSINDYPMTINDYVLYQNYPNPFNPNTKIAYKLKEGGYVKLYVYDIKGELIDVLINQNQEGGYYEVEFAAGSKNLASGTYLYQIIVKNENNIPVFTDFKKMILIK